MASSDEIKAEKVAFITGANSGIGKEIARQLALTGAYKKIYLGCRNKERALAARTELEGSTGESSFEIVDIDTSDVESARRAATYIDEPIDALVMNAGGTGGKTPLAITKSGVTEIFASNVLGHAVLLDELIKLGKLKTFAVFVGSESARGIPKMGVKRPSLATSSVDEFASICDGNYFNRHKFSSTLGYSQTKYIGALWIGAVARKNPSLRLITVSPGNTSGTEGLKDAPLLLRIFLKYVMMPIVAPLLGMVHGLDVGAKRLVDSIDDSSLKSGTFYGSHLDSLTGPIIDQSEILSDLNDPVIQDSALEAIRLFSRP